MWIGIEDPDPTVDSQGIRYPEEHGIKVHLFHRGLQDEIREANKEFIAQALKRALAAKEGRASQPAPLSLRDEVLPDAEVADFSREALARYRERTKIAEFDGLYLNLTIYRHARAAVSSLDAVMLNELSKSERTGWEWFASRGSAKSSDYAAAMKVEDRTARRHLNHFLKLGLVRKSGASTSTKYEIK